MEETRITLSDGKVVRVIIQRRKIIAQCCDRTIEISLDDIPIIEAALTAYYRKMLIDAGSRL
ncbi:MAG: hypothetical protein J7J75_03935 [Euryarchaeota archaeon]|nr:hypothetical protein [Euryarchaeota archaeon]MCD6158776.1 hypothetical protein [Euryarchaeota archaeon]RLF67935.1 MAG: hypothetical protein DRN26_00930 [Thermoplasmata archaeon]